MRKLNKKAKAVFALFSVCVLLLTGILAAAAYMVASAQEPEYALSSGAVVYDNVYTQVKLAGEGTVKRENGGSYQLTEGDASYTLGTSTVACPPGESSLEIFGGQYVFDLDGTVTTMGSHYVIDDLSTTRFCKLDENKYVIVGSGISSDDGYLSADGYLYVIVDSAGNARVVNGTTSVKLLNSAVLRAGSMEWDLAEGTVQMADYTIDLSSLANYEFASGQNYSYTIRGGNGGSGGDGGSG
ncbi:MAG: hypothetical protein Q4C82_10325, partial [Eubacteriales bacterium]|nr:hypothetical protein [Eubacteriales bacterium]